MAAASDDNSKAADTIPPLLAKVQAIRRKAQEQGLMASPAELLVQLPLWDERVRALPNALARSALFTVANRSDERQYLSMRKIASLKGIEILFTGEELRVDDADVFLQIVHLAKQQPLGEMVEFTGYTLLKALSWTTAKGSY